MTEVDTYYEESRAAIQIFGAAEVSLKVAIQASLTKGLVLAAASFFEATILLHLERIYRQKLAQAPSLAEFVKNKGMERQYHTYFDWDSSNGNRFFGLFGPDFAAAMKSKFKLDPNLEAATKDFLKLGRLRNELAHENFAAFSLDETLDDVFALYQSALRFVQALKSEIA